MKIKQVTVEHGVKIGTGGRQDNSMSRKCRDSSTKENITKLEEKKKMCITEEIKAIIVVKIKDTCMILLPKHEYTQIWIPFTLNTYYSLTSDFNHSFFK